MKAEDIEARLRGELENFARDSIEYYQKTGLNRPPNLSIYAKRLKEFAMRCNMWR